MLSPSPPPPTHPAFRPAASRAVAPRQGRAAVARVSAVAARDERSEGSGLDMSGVLSGEWAPTWCASAVKGVRGAVADRLPWQGAAPAARRPASERLGRQARLPRPRPFIHPHACCGTMPNTDTTPLPRLPHDAPRKPHSSYTARACSVELHGTCVSALLVLHCAGAEPCAVPSPL